MTESRSAPSPIQTSHGAATGKVPGTPVDDVLILREEDLAVDPGAALARLRAATHGGGATRVLFVGPEAKGVAAVTTPKKLVAAAGTEVEPGVLASPLQGPGDTAITDPAVMVEAMQALAVDLDLELQTMSGTLASADTWGCRQSVRAAREMIGWLADSCGQVDACLGGLDIPAVAIPTSALIRDTARRLQADHEQLRFVFGLPGDPDEAVILGAPVAVRAALRLGVQLVTERIGGVGALRLRADVIDGEVHLRIRGHGQPQSVHTNSRVAQLQGLMMQLEGRIEPCPDDQHPASTGMVLCLPAAPCCTIHR